MGRVTAVVCAAFDPAGDAAIYVVRERVRLAGISLPDRPPHRPHFSLAAARVERGDELDRLVEVAAGVATRHSPIPLTLNEVGRFGRSGVLWLGPDRCPALADLQRDSVESIAATGWPAAFGERTEPAQWIAHCTLATRVPKPELREVQQAVRVGYEPVAATVDALAVILVGGSGDIAHFALEWRH